MLKLKKMFLEAEVAVRKTCPECEGKRVIAHPGWTLYWATFGAKGRLMSSKEDAKWFYEQGYECTPSEEVYCGECDGAGKVETWVKLEDLFDEMTLTEAVIDVAATMAGGA